MSNGKSIVKTKGVRFQFCNGTELTYDIFKPMVTEGKKLSFNVPFNLRRNLVTGELRKVEMTKWVSQKFDKRIVLEDYKTVPFGYRVAGWTEANYRRTPGINQLGFMDEDDDDVFVENDW